VDQLSNTRKRVELMLPKQKDIEIPLLEVLVEIGGQGKPKEIYPLVTKKFPKIRDEDLAEALPSGGNKWTNRIQWVKQRLLEKGELYSPRRGIWTITDKGRKRVEKKVPSIPTVNFVSCMKIMRYRSVHNYLIN